KEGNAQSGRLEDQRCFLPRSRSTPATISSAQARRLDDQRVALPALPGISGGSERKANGVTMVSLPKSISFTSETEYQKQLQSPAQVNYLSVNFKFQR
uniref:Uncharacterized protein n=1 Tax=Takifugu rubripes TaxID=31033 RepID=A0A674PMT4_TAKRU